MCQKNSVEHPRGRYIPCQLSDEQSVRLQTVFAGAGFREVYFRYLDDCRTLARWKATLAAELTVWKALRSVGLHYPETCLLGVYERT